MLDGLTAYVTGASQGLGRAIAVAMADEGANVALAARSDGIYGTAERIDDPDRTLAVETDVTDEAAVEASIAATVERFGGLDCLVNNAGIPGPQVPVETIDRADIDRVFAVNVVGAFLTVKHAIDHLRESDRGSIVNIGSMQGKKPAPYSGPYAATKAALIGMTRTLAFEFGADGVTVNTVCPGATAGDRIERVIRERAEAYDISPEEARRRLYLDETALGEMVEPEDVSAMVVYLASEQGRHVTAQAVNVSSGAVWY